MGIRIRQALPGDAEALLAIYAPYVTDTAVTFDYEVPSPEAFRDRMVRTLQTYPFLAAEEEGRLLGYACAGPFKGRAAYDWSVETTIYVDRDQRRRGIGYALEKRLEDILRSQHIQNVNACISCPREEEDPFLTRDSILFHERMGYSLVGTFHDCGYKFGRWYHMVWMEKMLGDHRVPAEPVIPYPDLVLP